MNKLYFLDGAVEVERHPQADLMEELWRQGRTMAEIADAVGLTSRKIDALRDKGAVSMPKRTLGFNGGADKAQRDPAPSELRRRCLAVQATWTPERWSEAAVGSRMLSNSEMRTAEPLRRGRAATPVGIGVEEGRQ